MKKPSYTELENRIKELERIVAENKGAEQELLESNRTLKEVQRVAKIGSWLYDPETEVLNWSEELYHIFGMEVKKEPPHYEENRKIIHPDDWGLFDTAVNKALTDGIGYDLELRITHPSGEIRYVHARGYVEKDDRGIVKGLIGTTQDITENKRAQDALVKSEERYRALFENIPINTIVVDKEGKITASKFPEHPDEIVKPKIGDVMYIDFAQTRQLDMYKELMDSIKSGTPKEYLDLKYDHKFLHIRISPYQDGAIITAIDTTPVRRLESELQHIHKMESIGTMAGGIAHEFNNILGIIIGNTELAMEEIPEYNPALDYVKEIREASLRAKDIVRQIMSFARKTPADRIPIEIGAIVKDSLKLLKSTIQKSIAINERILCTSEVILGNKTEISQVLMNLCKNSDYAMKGGIGEIEVSLEPVSLNNRTVSEYEDLEAGEYVKLTVKDTGEGIDPKIMDRILDPYFTTKDIDKGIGMGLAVVYGIIKKHDGAIKIESELGKGTTVEALFPISDARVEKEAKYSEILPTGNERILFVDDEPSLVSIAVHILGQQGYEVTGLRSSTEALDLFQKEPDQYDLIITDMAMPEMPGDKLIEEVLRIRPNIPIILCSGYSDRINEEMLNEHGMMTYVMKPINGVELIKIVRNVLDKAEIRL
ncbi:MAG: response regulator [Deltaproteobacteria bacterium]|nr:response regulator [Deltaproteobacteria bacterium]